MNDKLNSLDLPGLAEAYDLECKAAQGRDARGNCRRFLEELQRDGECRWRHHSAGRTGKPRGQFQALGLADVERVRKALWDNLHNRKQVSINLLAEEDIQSVEIDGKRCCVSGAARFPSSKPVHMAATRWVELICAVTRRLPCGR